MRPIDSHAHVHFPQFDEDRDAVIDRAREAGLVAIVEIGTNLESSQATVALAEQHDLIYATVGVHPHDANTVDSDALDELRALARHPKVVAIGEIGLDYYHDHSPRPVQRQVFADQLELATDLEMPVVIHSREAHDDVLETLQDWQGTGVMHTYAAGPERLDEVLAMGLCVGLSGPVTFSNAKQLRKVAAKVPLDRLLVETDCPYLTPEPHRGKRNEPAYVRHVAQAVASVRRVTLKTVAQTTTENSERLFGVNRT